MVDKNTICSFHYTITMNLFSAKKKKNLHFFSYISCAYWPQIQFPSNVSCKLVTQERMKIRDNAFLNQINECEANPIYFVFYGMSSIVKETRRIHWVQDSSLTIAYSPSWKYYFVIFEDYEWLRILLHWIDAVQLIRVKIN